MSKLLIPLLSFFCLIATSGLAQKVFYQPYDASTNSPVGGIKEVERLFFVEFQYPIEAVKKGVEGSVTLAFQLYPEGVAGDLKILSSSNPMLTTEAMRMFKKIQWTKNKYRPTHMTNRDKFTVEFSLKKWVKIYKKRDYQYHEYPINPIDTSEAVFFIKAVETKPTPVFSDGNYSSFNDYIAKKMRYPETAVKLNLKGEVVVAFIIEQSGQITNIEVRKGMNGGCTQEALRLVKNVTWIPGQVEGKAVRTQMLTAIGFGMSSSSFLENYGGN